MYLHFSLVLVEGKDVGGDTLKEEEEALDKDVPQHGRHQYATEVPEYLEGGKVSIEMKTLLNMVNNYQFNKVYMASFKTAFSMYYRIIRTIIYVTRTGWILFN